MSRNKLTVKQGRIILLLFLFVLIIYIGWSLTPDAVVLVIRDVRTNEKLLTEYVSIGDALNFGWIHSLESFPWQEHFYITPNHTLMLHTISFPSFGAGVPEDRGAAVRIEDGLIIMYEINDEFDEIVWLNSHDFVQNITINGEVVTSGEDLPERELRMTIEKR